MSQLPVGTTAARNFLESVARAGAMVALVAWQPWLGWGLIKNFVGKAIEILILDPTADEATALAIAAKYVSDRRKFDDAYIQAKLIDQNTALTPAQQQERLNAILQTQHDFIRRGPVA